MGLVAPQTVRVAGVSTITPRDLAKRVTYGIIYGISPFGLAKQLECDMSNASTLINSFLGFFPEVRHSASATIGHIQLGGIGDECGGTTPKVYRFRLLWVVAA